MLPSMARSKALSDNTFVTEEVESDDQLDPSRTLPPHGSRVSKPLLEKRANDEQHTRAEAGSPAVFFSALTLLAILGGLVGGVLVAVGNHLFFARLNDKASHVASQFWVTAAKNLFPKVVQILFGISLSCSITQAVST